MVTAAQQRVALCVLTFVLPSVFHVSEAGLSLKRGGNSSRWLSAL